MTGVLRTARDICDVLICAGIDTTISGMMRDMLTSGTSAVRVCVADSGEIERHRIDPRQFMLDLPDPVQYEPQKPTKPHAAFTGKSPWGRRKKR